MSLETASFIPQLNSANPPSGDPVANASDHLRLLKAAVKGSFPNLGNAAVTPTAQQLSNNLVPVGGILIWSGSSASIPAGWVLCDGGTYSKLDGSGNITTPNLKDRFVVGAGATYAVGASGGAVSHTHTISVAGTSLTQAQIPNLGITINDPGHNHGVNDPGHAHTIPGPVYGPGGKNSAFFTSGGIGPSWTSPQTDGSGTGIWLSGSYTGISAYTNSTGGGVGQAHGHTASSDWQGTLPPYYALCYIMKL